MLDVLSANPPHMSSEPIPVASGRYGIQDSMRLQTANMAPGMAVSRSAATDGTKYLDVYIFGSASARPEFFGVLATKGSSPTLVDAVTVANDDTVQILYQGYTPVSLAPGYVCFPGQFLEPIPSGTFQGLFKPVNAGGRGPAMAQDYFDNTAGTVGQWVGAFINPMPIGSGLLGENTTASTVVTNVAVRTAYDKTVTIPKNTIKTGDHYRIGGYVRSVHNATNTGLFELWFNGLTVPTGALLTSAAFANTELTSGSLVRFSCDVTIISATTMKASGTVSVNDVITTSGTAGAVGTLDITVDNAVTFSITPGGASGNDQTQLEDLFVQKLN